MTDTEVDAARIAALEQRQRRLVRQLRWLLIAVLLLACLACWQQLHNRWLLAQSEGIVELLQLMEPFCEPSGHRQPPMRL